MIALCEKSSQQARSRNSKRITASHLKQAVMADEQFDFLEDIMAKVPEVPLPTENSNQGNGSDEEANNSGTPGSAKKPRKPRTRKPKDEDSYQEGDYNDGVCVIFKAAGEDLEEENLTISYDEEIVDGSTSLYCHGLETWLSGIE